LAIFSKLYRKKFKFHHDVPITVTVRYVSPLYIYDKTSPDSS